LSKTYISTGRKCRNKCLC